MGSIRYDLSTNIPRDYIIKLLYIAMSQFDNDWPSIMHSHYFSELFYITSGEGVFQIEGKRVSVKTNDLVIINPNVSHSEKSRVSHPLKYFVLGIEGVAFDFLDEDSKYRIVTCNEDGKNFEKILASVLRESEEKRPHYVDICNAYLKIFLAEFVRFSSFQLSDTTFNDILPECEKIKSFIDINLSKDISLDYLAELVHLNKYYLSHSFIKAYGISPIKYLIEQRIRCSKELLENTNYSIFQITESTGFTSQSYFGQCFKKHTGLTPTEYRRKIKSSK